MWVDRELWRARAMSVGEAEELAQTCFAALWNRRAERGGKVHRYPTITRVYEGSTCYLIVSGRLTFGPESGPEYAKRFYRNKPKPEVKATA